MAFQYNTVLEYDNVEGPIYYDHQTLFIINTASLVSAGRMRTDCGDMRFYDDDGVTKLSYWVEPGTANSETTHVWVRIPLINYEVKYITMHHGDPSAESESNGVDTFLVFLDGTNLNGWVTEDPGHSEWIYDGNNHHVANVDGEIRVTSDPGNGVCGFINFVEIPNDVIIEHRTKANHVGYGYQNGIAFHDVLGGDISMLTFSDISNGIFYSRIVAYLVGYTPTVILDSISADVYYKFRYVFDVHIHRVGIYVFDDNYNILGALEDTPTISGSASTLRGIRSGDFTFGYSVQCDHTHSWIFVRNNAHQSIVRCAATNTLIDAHTNTMVKMVKIP